MTTYTSPYTGQTISPSQVGYEALSISTDTALEWPINGNTTDVVANIIEVTATVGGLKLFLPPATQVSPGQSALIKNVGSNSFTVVNYGGTTIITIASGVAQYVYLTNNSTINGSWTSVTFGAGTSSANAATLAGYGLNAVNTSLNTVTPVTTISANYTLGYTDLASLYVWTGGAGAITLPSTATAGSSWFVIIKNNGTGILTVTPQGGDTIDSQVNKQLQIQDSLVVVCNGTTFFSYAYGQSSQFFFTQLVKVVTGGTVTLTSSEAANVIQEYQGALVSNCTVVVPPTVQLYTLRNTTTNAYTLTFTTGVIGGANLLVPQGQTIIAICDGTNVYNAQSATSSSFNAITLGNGTAANPSLSFVGDAATGIYLAASNQLGFAVGGVNAAKLTSTGMVVPVGIFGGNF